MTWYLTRIRSGYVPKKTYHIVKATTKKMHPKLDGELFPLPASGSVTTTDKGIADELNQVYGNKGTGELVVAEQPYTGSRGEADHRYFFGAQKQVTWVWADVDGVVKEVPEHVARELHLPIVEKPRKRRNAK